MRNARRAAPMVYAAVILAALLISPGKVFLVACVVGAVLLSAFYVVTQPKGVSPDPERAMSRGARRAARRAR